MNPKYVAGPNIDLDRGWSETGKAGASRNAALARSPRRREGTSVDCPSLTARPRRSPRGHGPSA